MISADSLFFTDSVILFIESGDEYETRRHKNLSSRDQLIAALETQIQKQEEIIKTQEETIRILEEHNNELTGIFDKILKP